MPRTETTCANSDFSLAQNYDIGKYIPLCINCPNELCFNLLKNHHKPSPGFKTYSTIEKSDGTIDRRPLTYETIMKYSWLVYSNEKSGLFCLPCSVMSKSMSHEAKSIYAGKNDPVILVREPLQNFKKVTGQRDNKLLVHEESAFHKRNAMKARDFLATQRNPDLALKNIVAPVKYNATRHKTNFECLHFLVKQGLALRGHDESKSSSNKGNFLELLDFVRTKTNCSDSISGNSSHTSPDWQNEVIGITAKLARRKILEDIARAGCVSILFDETTDITGCSQLTIIARYIGANFDVHESVLGVCDAYAEALKFDSGELNGLTMSKIIINELIRIKIDINKIIAFGTDTCNLMTGEKNGVIANIRRTIPNVMHCFCLNHLTNLAIVNTFKSLTSTQQGINFIKIYSLKCLTLTHDKASI